MLLQLTVLRASSENERRLVEAPNEGRMRGGIGTL